jgi:hypothetical protein
MYSAAWHKFHALTAVQAMHAGVLRDIEQQKIKRERQVDFEMQQALEKEYKKIQSVRDGSQLPDLTR